MPLSGIVWLMATMKLQPRCCHTLWAAAISGLGEGGGGLASKLIHGVVLRLNVFMGCWTENLSVFLAISCRPSVFCHLGHSLGQLISEDSWFHSEQESRASERDEVRAFA